MLSSWKEIAHFFGKGVRTVQRWEKTLDLPIHRPAGAPSNVVLARTSDLEEWMHRGPVAKAVSQEASEASVQPTVSAELAELEGEVFRLAAWAGLNPQSDSSSSEADRLACLTALLARVSDEFLQERTARAA